MPPAWAPCLHENQHPTVACQSRCLGGCGRCLRCPAFSSCRLALLSALPHLFLAAPLLPGLWGNARAGSSAARQTERGPALECHGGPLSAFCRCLPCLDLLARHEGVHIPLAHD